MERCHPKRERASTYANFGNKRMSAIKAFELTEKELRRLNTIIRSKVISDHAIGNTIFEIDIPNDPLIEKRHKENHFSCGYYFYKYLKKRIQDENLYNAKGILKYGYIIELLLHDIRPFADFVGKLEDENYNFFIGGRANLEDAGWHFQGVNQLFYNCSHSTPVLDNKFACILSPVALRQTLELKMKRLIGIKILFIYEKAGKPIYLQHHYFFDFVIKHANSFIFDKRLDLKIVQKVFTFCNLSVHQGLMPMVWQMYYAIHFSQPLFYSKDDTYKNQWDINGAVKIKDYEDLNNKFLTNLRKDYPVKDVDIHIDFGKPEALVIKE